LPNLRRGLAAAVRPSGTPGRSSHCHIVHADCGKTAGSAEGLDAEARWVLREPPSVARRDVRPIKAFQIEPTLLLERSREPRIIAPIRPNND